MLECTYLFYSLYGLDLFLSISSVLKTTFLKERGKTDLNLKSMFDIECLSKTKADLEISDNQF